MGTIPYFLRSGVQYGEDWYGMNKNDIIKNVYIFNKTMIYTHVLNKGGKGIRSPIDDM